LIVPTEDKELNVDRRDLGEEWGENKKAIFEGL
jgi:hypothetical protein